MNEKYKKILDAKDRIFTTTFAIVSVFLGALISTGFKFSFDIFKNPKFYIQTCVSFFIMMMCFTSLKNDIINENKKNKKSDLSIAKERNNYYVKIVHDEHLEDEIAEAAFKETIRRKEQAIYRMVNRYTNDLKIVDGMCDYGIDHITKEKLTKEEYFKKKNIKGKLKRKIEKCIQKAELGQVYFIPITEYEILNGFTNIKNNGCDDAEMAIDESKLSFKENRKKATSFLIISLVMAMIGWDTIDGNFFASVLTYTGTILTSWISAITTAYSHIKELIRVEINRATFLNKHINKEILNKYKDMVE